MDKVWLQIKVGSAGDEDAFMKIQLECASGLRKRFDLSFQEVTSMNAVYEKAACPHYLCGEPATFLDCLKSSAGPHAVHSHTVYAFHC